MMNAAEAAGMADAMEKVAISGDTAREAIRKRLTQVKEHGGYSAAGAMAKSKADRLKKLLDVKKKNRDIGHQVTLSGGAGTHWKRTKGDIHGPAQRAAHSGVSSGRRAMMKAQGLSKSMAPWTLR
jgi:hypothetical protein